MKTDIYPGFGHTAKELSAYIYSSGVFTISLKGKEKRIIHFNAPDTIAFRSWLDAHKVRDVRKSSTV